MGAFHAVEVDYDIQHMRKGVERAMGSGAYGEVKPCTHFGTHKLRAVKRVQKASWSTRSKVMNEISILQAVCGRNPYVIEFVEYFEEWSTISLIFEFCSKGNVEDALAKGGLASSERAIAPLFWQLLNALGFLHAERIVHRDVKPPNMLLADVSTLKLADFGSACFAHEMLRAPEGTPAFFAPEQYQLPRGRGYSVPVDVWAAGVSLFMLLFPGSHPFADEDVVDKQRIKGGEFSVGWLTSGRATDLLTWCLMPNPDQRITAAQGLEHPWFAGYGLCTGSFAKPRPHKLILDSHGNWRPTYR
mmetsp:Transcript_62045/g.173239  ORF Transcript_62045/g.173239 Transcript_62045/m.173239 type:complete len:302 (+) Transcript_62045:113-1018(+)